MRAPSLFSKIITLVCFVSLLGGFVAYRSGVFADLVNSTDQQVVSENDSTKAKKDKQYSDSIRRQGVFDSAGRRVMYVEDDTTPYVILPGSKSVTPLFELEKTTDAGLARKLADSLNQLHKPERTYMPTSKSFGGPPIKLTPDSGK